MLSKLLRFLAVCNMLGGRVALLGHLLLYTSPITAAQCAILGTGSATARQALALGIFGRLPLQRSNLAHSAGNSPVVRHVPCHYCPAFNCPAPACIYPQASPCTSGASSSSCGPA